MKRTLLLLVSLLTSVIIMADGISRNAALLKAQQFMPNKRFAEGPTIPSAQAKARDKNQAFYVFNAEGDEGFVIVSGDDRTTPILGYSENGNLDVNQIPDNLRWWLESYVQQIEALGTSLTPTPKTTEVSNGVPIAPLIKSKWNQGRPYNYMCPDGNYVDYDETGYDTNNRCVTGCVATAMAQVMYYWNWPESCPALESYEAKGHTIKGLPATTFEWSTMRNTYTWGETGASANAVAKLMRYCGQAVQMQYSPDGSGAGVSPYDMASIFQYSSNCHAVFRDYYTTSWWESIIYDELAAMRPVLYSGHSKEGGHEFIIDGYDGNGLFHINWGWGGSPDSYYVLSLADPDNDSRNGYQYNQDAIISLQPAQPGEVIRPAMRSYIDDSQVSKTYDRQASGSSFSNVTLNGYISASYTLQPESSINAEIGWALYNNGTWLQTLSSKNISIKQATWSSYYNNETVSFGAGLQDGIYQICQVYRFAGETEWKRCNLGSRTWLADVTATSMTVRIPNTDNMSFKVNSISLPEQPEISKKMNVSVNVTNTGESNRLEISLWLQKQGASTWTNITSANSYTDPGTSTDVLLSFIPEEAGLYNLKITAGSDEEALKTITIKIAATEQIEIDGVTYLCTPDYKRAIIIKNENADRTISAITIPSKVLASGAECQVISIEENVFSNFYKVKTLVIPEGVETIGKYAFAYMTSLQKLTLPSTLKEIDEYVISGNSNLVAVESKATSPAAVSDNTFVNRIWNNETQQYDITPSPATLYVPIETKAKYDVITGWTQFAAIEEGELKEAVVAGLRYEYSTGRNTATVIADDSYNELASVTIPATVNIDNKTYKVNAVGNRAFYDCWNIKSISLSEGLETIGNYAFYHVGVSEVTLPTTLKSIGECAFEYCYNVKTLIISEGVENIGRYAFAYIIRLQKLTLPSTLKKIGEYIISGNNDLETVESKATSPVIVSDNTFLNRRWNSDTQQYDITPSPATLYIPIGTKATYEAITGWTQFAAIEEGELKEAVVAGLRYEYSTGRNIATVIADDSYKELASVTIPATVNIDSKTYKVTAIGKQAFYSCWNIKSLSLSEGLETIGNYAFYNVGTSEVTLPTTLKSIGEYAFEYCYNVKTLIISEGVENIGRYAFAYMTNLQNLTLPSALKEIGEYIINGNSSLETVESKATNPIAVSDNTFSHSKWNSETQQYDITPSPATLYVPIGTKTKYETITGWTQFAAIEEGELKEAMVAELRYLYSTGGNTATVIADDSYKELASVTIPATVNIDSKTYIVTAIGKQAFYSCWNIKSLSLSEGLETIGNYAFYNIGASEVTLPTTLKSIGECAFEYCYNVKTLIVPEGTETIDRYAFAYMTRLQKLTLPSTLKKIGEYIISGNNDLETVESKATSPVIVSDNTFLNRRWNSDTQQYDITPSPATLYIPIGTKATYEAITGWTQFAAIEEREETGNDVNLPIDAENDEKAYFNMNGQPIPYPQKGINIVKYANGKTEKILK